MRLWAEVYDSSDVLQAILTSLTGASVTEALDGAGTFSYNLSAADKDGVEQSLNERKVRLYVEMDNAQRELGRGIIQGRKVTSSEGGMQLTITGPDDMDALARRSTLLGRSYSAQSMQTIADSLISLVPGTS